MDEWLDWTKRALDGGTRTEFRSCVKVEVVVPGLSILTSLMVSVDVKQYLTMLRHWSQLVPNVSTDIQGH